MPVRAALIGRLDERFLAAVSARSLGLHRARVYRPAASASPGTSRAKDRLHHVEHRHAGVISSPYREASHGDLGLIIPQRRCDRPSAISYSGESA